MRDPAALRAFAERDWAAFERSEADHFRDYKRLYGPGAGILLGDELRRYAIAAKGIDALNRDREGDYATHLRVIEALRSVPPRRR